LHGLRDSFVVQTKDRDVQAAPGARDAFEDRLEAVVGLDDQAHGRAGASASG
jgi:hypothetical protein